MKKIIGLIFSAVLLLLLSITTLASDTVGGQITLTQFLEADLENTKSITIRTDLQDSVMVDKATFFTLADSIILTSNTDSKQIDFNGVYIMAEKNDGTYTFAYLTEDGGADKYSLMMSRLPCALYTANDVSQISKLIALAKTKDTSDAAEMSFSDISGHWAEATINEWSNKGIITGYPDGTFKPDNSVTRGELAKIITLAFDLKTQNELDYDDIDTSAWYYEYLQCSGRYIPVYALPVEYETNLPYTENYEKGGKGFLPSVDAIRVHVAEALVEIKKEQNNLDIELPQLQEVKAVLNETFKDEDYENLYAMHGSIPTNVSRMLNYTYLANNLDIMQGSADGYFRPYGKVTRAELITMIDRMLTK